MSLKRWQIVLCKITGTKMIIKDVINKGDPDEKYNCKFHNRNNGNYEYIHKNAEELEVFEENGLGFKNNGGQPQTSNIKSQTNI